MPTSANLIAFLTIIRKETVRILRIWTQTLLPSVITTILYFLIFGKIYGARLGSVQGISYMGFIVPGLVMLAIITNAFSNVVSSFFGSKFQKNIEEIMTSPTPNWVVISGFAGGGVIRGMFVGIIVLFVSLFFTKLQIHNIFAIVVFMLLTSAVFALAGLTNGIFATKFDDISIVPVFILTPLTYLGGVFYSVKELPEVWQIVSKFNPILYMVDGFRYGFFGIQDVNVWFSFGILVSLVFILGGLNWYLLNKGTGLKS